MKTDVSIINEVLFKGDLKDLTQEQRLEFYHKTCDSMGLNPLTKPFVFVEMDYPKRMTMAITKDGADQLRKIHGVSITKLEKCLDESKGIYSVTAYASDRHGRVDVSEGIVVITHPLLIYDKKSNSRITNPNGGKLLTGLEYANSLMKAESKAKTRVTKSIVGLCWLAEEEAEDIPTNDERFINIEKNEAVVASDYIPAIQLEKSTSEQLIKFNELIIKLEKNEAYVKKGLSAMRVSCLEESTQSQMNTWINALESSLNKKIESGVNSNESKSMDS